MKINGLSTSIPDVYTNNLAGVSLLEEFCRCNAARELLSSSQEIKPLMVGLSANIAHAGAILIEDGSYFKSLIYLPEDSPLEGKIAMLAFEVFNTFKSKPSHELGIRASRGEVAMDAFALAKETIEEKTVQESDELILQCMPEWKIPLQYSDMDPIFARFWQEVTCHTEHYRQHWIENYQAAYCGKLDHLLDRKSCSTTQQDLCDYEALKELEKKDLDAYENKIQDRICKIFSVADKTTRANPQVNRFAEKFCSPELSSDARDC